MNAVFNVAGGVANMAISLVVVPLCIGYIGKGLFGVYTLVAGLAQNTPLLHMGMASAVSRHSAAHLARGEHDELNAVVNTAVVYFRVASVIFIGLMLLVAFFCIEWFIKVPALVPVARVCVVIFGTIEGLVMFIGPVGAVLRAIERFDLVSISTTSSRVVRLVVLAVALPLCDSEAGLVCVTTVMVLTNLLPIVAHRILAVRYTPSLRLSMRLARMRLVWPMIKFGIGTITWHWAQTMVDYLPILIIGYYLSTEDVTDYSVPCRAFMLVSMLVVDIMVVLLPTASRLTATDRREELCELLLRSSKYAGGVSVAGCAGMGILSPLLLHLWVGESFVYSAVILTVLAAGRALFFIQTSSFYILVGMAKQKVPALVALVSVALMAGVQGLVLAYTDWHLVGAAAVTTVTLTVGWGLAMPVYVCRQVDASLRQYYMIVLVRPILACLPAAAVWLALRFVPLDYGWFTLAGALLSGALLVLPGWWFVLFDDWDRRLVIEKLTALRNKIRRTSAPQAPQAEPPGKEEAPLPGEMSSPQEWPIDD